MALAVLTDVSFTFNGTDLSDHVESITVNSSQPGQEITCMGDVGHTILPGLPDCSIDVTFRQDYATTKVDAVIWSALNGGTSQSFTIKPTSGVVGISNPKYTGNAFVQDYKPLSGSIGDTADATVTLVVDGTITRATS